MPIVLVNDLEITVVVWGFEDGILCLCFGF